MRAISTRRARAGCALCVALAAAAQSAPARAASKPAVAAASLEELRWSPDGATLAGIADAGKRGASIRAYDGASGAPSWSLALDAVRESRRGKRLELEGWQPSSVAGEILLEAKGDLFVADVKGPTVRRLTETAAPESGATLSPDGSRVAFVRQGDLWVIELADGKETRLTSDGRPPAVINGARPEPASEIFAGGAGFAWAPESRTLAFLRKNGDATELSVVNVVAPAPQTLETGSAAIGAITEVHWRFDARALGVERRAASGDRYDLLLCHPEKRYCRPLAQRPADATSPARRDFWFLSQGFVWGTTQSAHDVLAYFDTLGRERGPLLAGEWSEPRIEAGDPLGEILLVRAARPMPAGGSEQALLRVPLSKGAVELLAGGNPPEILVSPAASGFVIAFPAPNGASRRELRGADGKTISPLPPPG